MPSKYHLSTKVIKFLGNFIIEPHKSQVTLKCIMEKKLAMAATPPPKPNPIKKFIDKNHDWNRANNNSSIIEHDQI